MFGDEDTRKLLESRHDVAAAEDPSKVAESEAMQAAVIESRGDLEVKRRGLVNSLTALAQDKSETETETASYHNGKKKFLKRYRHVRGKVKDALLNPDPDDMPDETELQRRAKTFNRSFALTASDLHSLGLDNLVETISPLVTALKTAPDLKDLGHYELMHRDFLVLKEAKTELQREQKEDSEAMNVVRNARAELNTTLTAHALLIESCLVRQARAGELGRYIKAYDPAYAARRTAGVSIHEEPGAANLEEEVSVSAGTGAGAEETPPSNS